MTSVGTKRPGGSCVTEAATSTRIWLLVKDIASAILWFFAFSLGFWLLGKVSEVMLSPFTAFFRALCS